MKISAAGVGVGALLGCIGRGAVVLLNLGPDSVPLAVIALPSAGIGLLVGAIAGAFGKPLLGAAIGAILSGVVFELFMFSCASLIGQFNQKAGADFFLQTVVYGLQMAVVGALAGGIGGLVGSAADTTLVPTPTDFLPPGEADEKPEKTDTPQKHTAMGSEFSERIRRKEVRE